MPPHLQALIVPALLCLAPVLGFLAMLLFLDSYALVPPLQTLALIVAGCATAGASYLVNAALIEHLTIDLEHFSRYVAPLVEESLKALLIVWLIRTHRIGFLVDAAIMGFAIGCGFALVENLYALSRIPDAGAATWVVRGFGTAIMHGGATAAFALLSLAVLENDERHGFMALVPGLAVAIVLHSAFNHMNHESVIATVAALLVVPLLLLGAYHRSERTLAAWLGHGFDADADLLASMRSGAFTESPAGRYLATLKHRFSGLAIADLLAYLRLFTELSLRAKGLLLMRENGFEPAVDSDTREQFIELDYLARNIGPTGLLALHPLLPMRRKALRALYLL